jgi:1-deoxy-D-xylulose-5-phosphate reductoisomerase
MGSSIKNIAILGATGSIGRQTLQVIRNLPGRFRIVGLTAGQNLELLSEQIKEFKPKYIHSQSQSLKTKSQRYKLLSPEEIASLPEVDTVVIATSDKVGLNATLAAVKAGKSVAIANKEPLVMAGEIITREAKLSGARILPIDSEHSAIWQCLNGEPQPPDRIILTASGGPFRGYSTAQLGKVTPAAALKHPSWKMGKKVTIDSATLMNKGLEIIEAHWLFNIPIDRINVIIHPQSIIHSMVEFVDGTFKAQLSYPDMRFPIQYALTYPERVFNPDLPKLDWLKIKDLTFEPPDFETFPCLQLAIEAAKTGGTSPVVLCAADEVAVEFFMQGNIKFTDIALLVKQALRKHKTIFDPTLADIIKTDEDTRKYVIKLVDKKN